MISRRSLKDTCGRGKFEYARVLTTNGMFPNVIAAIIADYAQTHQLLDWISWEKLDQASIWANPKALEVGWLDLDYLFTHGTRKELEHFARNTAAGDVIMDHLDVFRDMPELWTNAAMFEYLWTRYLQTSGVENDRPNYTLMSANTHPKAIITIAREQSYNFAEKVSGALLSMNPAADEYLAIHPALINKACVHANPAPKMLDRTRRFYSDRGMSSYISWNSHEWAVEYTRTHPELIDYYGLSMNPSIFVDARDVVIKMLCGK